MNGQVEQRYCSRIVSQIQCTMDIHLQSVSVSLSSKALNTLGSLAISTLQLESVSYCGFTYLISAVTVSGKGFLSEFVGRVSFG